MINQRHCQAPALTSTHQEIGEGRFAFTLDVRHPLFGPLIHQRVVFKEDAA